jgi:predicted ATPase
MTERIVFIGAQHSGKTTLAKRLSEETGTPLITESVRTVAGVLGIKHDSDMLTMAHRTVWQIGIITEQLRQESRYESFVSDRGTVDNFAYLHLLADDRAFGLPADVYAHLETLCEKAAQAYTHVFFLFPVPGSCRPDGFRRDDKGYQSLIVEKILHIVWRWRLPMTQVPADLCEKGRYDYVTGRLPNCLWGAY